MPTINIDKYAIHIDVVQERLSLSVVVSIRDTESETIVEERSIPFERSITWTYSGEPEEQI